MNWHGRVAGSQTSLIRDHSLSITLRPPRASARTISFAIAGDNIVAPEWIDTHAHLDDERFHGDLPAVLERAAQAGVQWIIVIATTALDSPRCLQLAQRHAPLRTTVGIQPNHVAEATPTAWDTVVSLADRPEVVALGETGLDRAMRRHPAVR